MSSDSVSKEYDNNVWSISYMIDKLKQILAMTSEKIINKYTGQITEYRKYYLQVLDMQKIGLLNPEMTKPFVINLSDLPDKVKIELQSLDKLERGYVIRQAVARLFEDVNSRLYHDSISRVLKVVLER